MPAHWYLFQYMHDLRRREPRNVGVALHADGQWHFQFFGQRGDGSIDGRRLGARGLEKDLYEEWIRYFQRKAQEGTWEDALTLGQRRPTNFAVRPGGTILEDQSMWDVTLHTLYTELVDEPATTRSLVDDVLDLFRSLDVEPVRDIKLPGKWSDDSREDRIPFSFGVNGTALPVDAVADRPQALQALRGRIDAVERVASPRAIIAVTRRDLDREEEMEPLIRSIEKDAQVLDLNMEKPERELATLLETYT